MAVQLEEEGGAAPANVPRIGKTKRREVAREAAPEDEVPGT